MNEGIVGLVAHTSRTVKSNDITKHERYDPKIDDRSGMKPSSVFYFPILHNSTSQCIAVLQLFHLQVDTINLTKYNYFRNILLRVMKH